VSLTDCVDVSWYIGDPGDGREDSIFQKSANLAYAMAYMQSALQVAGYSKSLWESDLAEYERTSLEHIGTFDRIHLTENQTIKRLVSKLTSYRKSSNGNVKEIARFTRLRRRGDEVGIRASPRAKRAVSTGSNMIFVFQESTRTDFVIIGRITVRQPGKVRRWRNVQGACHMVGRHQPSRPERR
jgi:hypothetical protein